MRYLKTSPNSLNLSACMTKYMYDKLVEAAPEKKPDYLDKGDMMHIMLAEYYKLKMMPPDERLPHGPMIEQAIEKGRFKVISLDLEIEAAEDEVIPTFREYCLFWQNDPEFPISVEQPVVLPLLERPDTEEEEGLTILFEMIPDIVFENRQGYMTWTDHKTRQRNREAIPLSNQFVAMAWASGTGRSMRNNIGFQKTLPPEKKFTRDFFVYPRGVIDWWVEWSIYRAQFIDACTRSNNFPPDFTVCDKFDACWFLDVCMQSPQDRQRFLNENFIKRARHVSIYDRRME